MKRCNAPKDPSQLTSKMAEGPCESWLSFPGPLMTCSWGKRSIYQIAHPVLILHVSKNHLSDRLYSVQSYGICWRYIKWKKYISKFEPKRYSRLNLTSSFVLCRSLFSLENVGTNVRRSGGPPPMYRQHWRGVNIILHEHGNPL